ncbi:MAG TPA: AbrB family transcriptional regulator [Paracoccaceae bacterium]|nr:AbrB family transcriptional regulator [Paracoccaceae bacterium]
MRRLPPFLARLPLVTFAIAAAGVAAFHVAALPLPFMLGPMFACLLAALAGVKMRGAGSLGTAMRTILGVAVGASVTPELLGRLPGMAYSVALVLPMILLCGLIGMPYFRRVCGFDPVTSWYAAMPGGLQDMLAFGEEAGARLRSLSLIHATRVLAIVTLAPFLLVWLFGTGVTRPPGSPMAELPLSEMAVMVVTALAGWKIAEAVGLFGAAILGPLILTAVASIAGLITQRPPAEAIFAAQFFIGMAVGVHYTGITAREFSRDVLAGLGYCVLLALISLGFAEIAVLLGFAPPMEAFLSFAPGGQAEMAVLAIVAGADVAFVVTHHIVRLLAVILGAPVAFRWLRRRVPVAVERRGGSD